MHDNRNSKMMIKLIFILFIYFNLIDAYRITKRNQPIFRYLNCEQLSESVLNLKNLCEIGQHNDHQFNSFYKLDLSSTLNPISFYLNNCDLKNYFKSAFKSNYEQLIRQIYSEQFMNEDLVHFLSNTRKVRNEMDLLYKRIETDIYQNFMNYSIIDQNMLPNWFERRCKKELNRLLDNIVKIKDGFLTPELLNSTMLQEVLKNYEILNSNPFFNGEHLHNFYTKQILSSPKFIYNSEQSTDRAVLKYSLFIPVFDKSQNSKNCVPVEQLPEFFSTDLKKIEHYKV